jgi:hypothetical protein
MKIFHPTITGSLDISGSINVTGGQLNGTSSYALTASYAMNGGGGGGIPGGSNTQIQYNSASVFAGVPTLVYNGTTLAATGSFTGSFTGLFNGSITTAATASYATEFSIGSTITKYSVTSAPGTATYGCFSVATGSYTAAMCKYTLYNGANARAGEFMTVWNDGNINYTDVATTDIGNTSPITLSSILTATQMQINATTTSGGWTIKMLATFI